MREAVEGLGGHEEDQLQISELNAVQTVLDATERLG